MLGPLVMSVFAHGWSHRPSALLPVIAWAAVTLLRAGDSQEGMTEAFRTMCYLLTFLAGAAAWHGRDDRRIAVLWMCTSVAVCVYAQMQHFGWDPVEEFRQWHSESRPFSTFGNADFLGAHLAFTLPLFIAMGMAAGRPSMHWRIHLAMVFCLWTLLDTKSRGALLGMFTGASLMLVMLFFSSGPLRLTGAYRNRAKVFAIVIAVFALAFFPWSSLSRRTDRLMLWSGTCRMVRTSPFAGWGVGKFASEFPPFAPPAFAARMKADNTFAEHPHSEYLQIAEESGLIGLGIFLWLLSTLLRPAFLRAKGGDVMAAAALGSLVAILVHIGVDRNFRLASTAIPFWILAGIIAAPDPKGTWYLLPEKVPGTFFKPLLVSTIVLSLASGAWFLRPLLASYRVAGETDFLKQAADVPADQLESQRAARATDPQFQMAIGNAYAKEGKFPKAVEAFAEALRLDPKNTAAANNLGNSWFMMSQFDPAIDAYHRVLALDPSNKDARFNLAFALFHQRKIKEALAECDILLRMDPQNAKALQLRAQLAP